VNYEYLASFPTAEQFLAVENLADPLNTYIGNPNLGLNETHNVNMNFNNYDYATRSGYGVYVGGQFNGNEIVSSTVYSASGNAPRLMPMSLGLMKPGMAYDGTKPIKKRAYF
jgi:hypothetical protein